jgi:hypothetical protein
MTGKVSRSARRGYSDPGRQAEDFYRTPPEATLALLEHDFVPGCVWEPACGDGAMSRVLEASGRKVISTDLVDRGFGEARRDFLMEQELLAPAIVTNPPFKLADSFVAKAFDLNVNYIAIFQRLAFLEGARRHQWLYKNNPPTRVWVFSKRLTLWRGDQESPGKGGAIPYAWFVWQRPAAGASTHLGWL